jgi:hypothetical protein
MGIDTDCAEMPRRGMADSDVPSWAMTSTWRREYDYAIDALAEEWRRRLEEGDDGR